MICAVVGVIVFSPLFFVINSVKCAFQFQRAEYLPEGGIFHRGDVDTAPFAFLASRRPKLCGNLLR
jgi:hypothetical protein